MHFLYRSRLEISMLEYLDASGSNIYSDHHGSNVVVILEPSADDAEQAGRRAEPLE
jgi:hypothetical protein